jgi:hypothetical protein
VAFHTKSEPLSPLAADYNLFGFSTPGVYPTQLSPIVACALTARFHPYPPKWAVSFSVALSIHRQFLNDALPVRKQAALCCPDFPLPYSEENNSDETVCNAKVRYCIYEKRNEFWSATFDSSNTLCSSQRSWWGLRSNSNTFLFP